MSDAKALPRPRQVTVGAGMALVACVLLVAAAFDAMRQVGTPDTRDAVTGYLGRPPGNGFGVTVDQALHAMRVVVLVDGALAAACAVLAVFALQRHRGARVALSVGALVLLLTAWFSGGFLPLLLVGATVLLWSAPARDWFAGRPPRPVPDRSTPDRSTPVRGSTEAWAPHTLGRPEGREGRPAPVRQEQDRPTDGRPAPSPYPFGSAPGQSGQDAQPGQDAAPGQPGQPGAPAEQGRSEGQAGPATQPGPYGQPAASGQPTYGQPAHGHPTYGQPPTYGPPGGYGQPPGTWQVPPPAGYGGPVHDPGRRPGAVVAAAWLTWVLAGLVVLVYGAMLAMLIGLRDQILEAVRQDPGVARLQLSPQDLVALLWVIGVVIVFWCLSSMVLALLAYRRMSWARVVLAVSAVIAGLLGLVAFPVGLVITLGAFATAGLLFAPPANDWFAGRPPRVQGGPGGGPYGGYDGYGAGHYPYPYGQQPGQQGQPAGQQGQPGEQSPPRGDERDNVW